MSIQGRVVAGWDKAGPGSHASVRATYTVTALAILRIMGGGLDAVAWLMFHAAFCVFAVATFCVGERAVDGN